MFDSVAGAMEKKPASQECFSQRDTIHIWRVQSDCAGKGQRTCHRDTQGDHQDRKVSSTLVVATSWSSWRAGV